jgi:hypothetical protein
MNTDAANHQPEVFAVRDCAMVALATGRRAQNLKELRAELQAVDTSSIYFHFWGVLLQPGFEEREYNNDFAEWVRHQLHDPVLAERLGVIDPSDYEDLEQLRAELCDAVEARLEEREIIAWSLPDQQFEFRRSQIVVFRTPNCIAEPADLPGALGHMSTSSLFYHFIDARRRVPEGTDDFRAWLCQWGEKYRALIDALAGVDPYFTTLVDLRQRLAALCADQLS